MILSEMLRKAVFLITSAQSENRRFGSAFAIFKKGQLTYLLTCAHVVKEVGGSDEVLAGAYPARVVALGSEDGPDDLALLEIEPSMEIPLLPLSPYGSRGKPFITAGFQLFGDQYLIRPLQGRLGDQVALESRGSKKRILAWDLKILDDYCLQPGYSGAPIVDASGSGVLGIISHRQGVGERGLAISIEALEQIWSKAPSHTVGLDVLFEWHSPFYAPTALVLHYESEGIETNVTKRHEKPKTVIGLLPQDIAATFKNRFEEYVVLQEYLTTTRLVAVVGHGGTGKTALVCKVLVDLERQTNNIAGFIYLTAANLQTITLESIFTAIGQVLSCERELVGAYNKARKDVRERIEILISRLQAKDTTYILLLDNFEKYQDDFGYINDPELSLFLEMILTHRSALRVIITTRVMPRLPTTVSGRFQPILLDQGLPIKYAAQLLKELDPDNSGGLKHASQEMLFELARRSGGYPRALQAIATLLREDPVLTPAELLANERLFSGDVVDSLVREALKQLDERALQVMQAVSVYGQPVPESAITFLLKPFQDATEVKELLRYLIRAYFAIFSKANHTVSLHPIDRAFVYQSIPDDPSATEEGLSRRSLSLRAADFFSETRTPEERWNSISDLSPQLSEFDHRIMAADFHTAAQLLDGIDKYLLLWGHSYKVLTMREALAGKLDDESLQLNQAKSMGTAYKRIGFLDKASEYFQEMYDKALELDDKENQISALNELSNVYRRQTEYERAISYSERALSMAQDTKARENEARVLIDLGKIHWCLGSYNKALDSCSSSLDIAREVKDRNEEGYALLCVGNCYSSMTFPGKALTAYQEALGIFRDIGNRQGEANVLQDLCYVYLSLKDLELAVDNGRAGLDIYYDISNQRGVGHCAFVLARVYRAKRELEKALRFAEQALASLLDTNVPEARSAQALVQVVKAGMRQDRQAEAQALLECANSPANTADIRETLDFAEEARAIAHTEGFTDILAAAWTFIETTKSKIDTREA